MGKAQRKVVACLALLLTSSAFAFAFALDPSLDVSQYAHTAWKIREGFTRGTIFSVAQTPDGYLWLGTEFGLYRFDGVRAIPWQPPAGEQLPGNSIKALLVARDGTLWIGTPKGLARWKNGKLTQCPEVAGQAIGPLLEDKEGTIWFGAQEPGRLCALRPGTVQCYGAGSFGDSVIALYEDRKGDLWVSAQTGIWRWAPGSPSHYMFPDRAVQANALIEDERGALLICTAILGGNPSTAMSSIEGLQQLVGGKIRSYALPPGFGQFRPTRLFRSSDGSLWIGSVQGLLHMHQGRIDRFAATDGLSGDVVRSIFEDREGTIWVSTQDGLDRFRQLAVPTISRNQGLSNSAAYVVQAAGDGSIWIVTAVGLDHWENGHVTVYGRQKAAGRITQTNQTVTTSARVTEIANSGLAGNARSLGLDDRGRLWASTNNGIFYFERGRFMPVADIPGGNIFSIAGDTQGKVWISNADQGLFRRTPEGAVQHIPWIWFGQKHAAVALLPDRMQGGIWLGFLDGGIAYLKDGQIRASYSVTDGLGGGSVNNLQLTSDGAVWAATDGGLSRVKDGHVATVSSKNGLPCDAVHWAMEDNDHSFWLYMPCGLVRIDRSELNTWVNNPKHVIKTGVFDASDGIRSRATAGRYGPKVTKSPDGKIWFAAMDGVGVIDPRHIPFNKLPPPVHIGQIIADGTTYDAAGGLRLPPRVRNLEIDYTALSLVEPEKVHFRFKLEGQDKDWREVVNRPRAEYSNLPPGKYRFHVIASNNSGVWNEQGATLDFAIAPAYFQTNWFRALCAVAFLAIFWTIYQLRVRALERRQALLERNQALLVRNQELLERHQSEIRALNEQLIQAQEAERMRIAGELHDGVLQQITSVTLRLAKVRSQVPPDSETNATVSGLQQKLIKIGTDIRHLSHELHPPLLQDAGLSTALSAYCEEFSKVRGLPVSCEMDESVQELSPGAALCIYRIVQEALGNAAKYSEAKKVEVRLTRADGRVCLSVSDDGVGCAPSVVGKLGGLGLINMRERVLQLNGTFEFDSAPGRGATVRVSVPFRPA